MHIIHITCNENYILLVLCTLTRKEIKKNPKDEYKEGTRTFVYYNIRKRLSLGWEGDAQV